jgi:uncharacterized protein with ParB-like and HNH nuclease domain
MSKLNVAKKTIFDLLSDNKADFLIPDYQRPCSWNEEQCQALWDDIFAFSFQGNDYEAFDANGSTAWPETARWRPVPRGCPATIR